MSSVAHPVHTIGHSTHSLEGILALLTRHGVTALADVRSAPYSRFNPHVNRESLQQRLTASGIAYLFLGRELGARPDDRSCYDNGRVQYARLARTDRFRAGIERVVRAANDHRVVLMCAEKEPLECHRTLLVAHALADLGVDVQHILADGRLESQAAAMERLLDVVGLPNQDLFHSKEELIEEARVRQAERIAYVDDKPTARSAREGP